MDFRRWVHLGFRSRRSLLSSHRRFLICFSPIYSEVFCLGRIKTNNSDCSLESRHDSRPCAVLATPVVLACVQFYLQRFQSPCGQLQLENGQWKTQKEVISKFLSVCCSEQGYEVLRCIALFCWGMNPGLYKDVPVSVPSGKTGLIRRACLAHCIVLTVIRAMCGSAQDRWSHGPHLNACRDTLSTTTIAENPRGHLPALGCHQCHTTALGNISQVALASFPRVIKCENSFRLPASFQNSRKKKKKTLAYVKF